MAPSNAKCGTTRMGNFAGRAGWTPATTTSKIVPQAGFQSLTNMFWEIIGVAEAVVVRTRLLKQGDVTQATDKSAIAIVIFLVVWVAAFIAGAAISDV